MRRQTIMAATANAPIAMTVARLWSSVMAPNFHQIDECVSEGNSKTPELFHHDRPFELTQRVLFVFNE